MEILEVAFQPIVNVHTGVCLGVEALARHHEQAGFPSVHALLDAAAEEGTLFRLELHLRRRAVERFVRLPGHERQLLFLNVDPRVSSMPDFTPGMTQPLLGEQGLPLGTVCFEIPEHQRFYDRTEDGDLLAQYRQQGYRVAVDDFGSGYAGLQLLYRLEPDYLKLDKFFVRAVDREPKKALFVSTVVSLAHTLGIQVIAEGVETEAEFRVCREIGCDYVQGFWVARPTLDAEGVLARYEAVSRVGAADRRVPGHDRDLLRSRMETPEPIHFPADSLRNVFEVFRRNKDRSHFPVVDGQRRPLGLLTERDLKEYVYSPYGRDLLMNRSLGKRVADFVSPVPIAPLESRVESVLEMLAMDPAAEGVLLTHEGAYAGFLSARALLHAMNEKNLTLAREQNPLTRLPGNRTIHGHLSEVLSRGEPRALIYLDIDHFKPFNDAHGFRVGDRVLLLMADLLRTASAGRDCFLGHIGGDDFIVSSPVGADGREGLVTFVRGLLEKFRGDALAFHPRAALESGGFHAFDRRGRSRRYRTLEASAAILFVRSAGPALTPDAVGGLLADLKRRAKDSREHLACMEI